MRIGCVAKLTGASVRSLRHYEQQGLITPGRHPNGYRDYCTTTIDTVHQVRSLLSVGLPVYLIAELLRGTGSAQSPTIEPDDAVLDRIERYRDRLAERISGLTDQLAAVDGYLLRTRGTTGRKSA